MKKNYIKLNLNNPNTPMKTGNNSCIGTKPPS